MRGASSRFVEVQTREMLPARLTVGTVYCIAEEGVMLINHGNRTAQYPREVLDTVDGVLQVGNGGTGGSTKKAARDNLEAEWTGNKTQQVKKKTSETSDELYPTEKAVREAIEDAVFVYEHTQTTDAIAWFIDHNLDKKYVGALTINCDDEEIVGLEDWEASTENRLVIRFSAPLRGKAYVY